MRKSLLYILLTLILATPAHAQFFLTGDDPASLRWYSVETPYYQIVYPKGADSLARVYGRLLEQFREPMGRSIGEVPGQGLRKKMPVILHTHYPYSNGSVAYAPKRMDLYTQAEPYGGDPTPWPIQLAAHEPRHQAQMQLAGKGWMKAFPWIIGQAWNPVGWALYLDSSLGEGDAVAAETGLATGTRARTADFLEYFRVALDQGDYRNWERWYFGSYKHYTPDLYKISYMTVAGSRYLYDDPLFTQKVLARSLKKPLPFAPHNARRIIKAYTGAKKFKEIYPYIMNSFQQVWEADRQARAPFMDMEQVTRDEAFSVDYSSLVWEEGRLFAIREGYLYPAEIVEIKNGKTIRIHSVGSHSSGIFSEPVRRRLYWTETRRHPRWSLSGSSELCYLDLETEKLYTLTSGARYYYPHPSEDGNDILVVEYHTDGSQSVVILNADNGEPLRRWAAPSGIQITEATWMHKDIYAIGISLPGTGIYQLHEDGSWSTLLEPSAQKIIDIMGGDGKLEWTSDRTGVNESYMYRLEDNTLHQLTNTRYGASDFCGVENNLFFCAQTLQGRMIFRTPEDALANKSVNFADVHHYTIEDKLTEQERSLGPEPDFSAPVAFSSPKRYRKLGHTTLHSWLPGYVNVDNVMSGSMDLSYDTFSLGLSGFFQNTLSTFNGQVGYSAHPDPDTPQNWRHAAHVKAVYSGWLPVLEFQLDFNDSRARQYSVYDQDMGEGGFNRSLGAFLRNTPLLTGSLRAYIPLQFQRGSMFYGITPQVSYSLSNNCLDKGPIVTGQDPLHAEGTRFVRGIEKVNPSQNTIMQRVSASLRGYWVRSRAEMAIYPRWGIGLEGGVSLRPGILEYFAPNVYGYVYAYVPGFWRTQGLRLTGLVQQQLYPQLVRFGELAANTLPRGFEGATASTAAASFARQWKVTADYAIPIYVGDISVPGVFYIQKFLLSPHGDFTGLHNVGQPMQNLWSAGADLTASFKRILVFNFDFTLGVSFSYLGGSWYEKTGQEKPWSVGMIFSVDI